MKCKKNVLHHFDVWYWLLKRSVWIPYWLIAGRCHSDVMVESNHAQRWSICHEGFYQTDLMTGCQTNMYAGTGQDIGVRVELIGRRVRLTPSSSRGMLDEFLMILMIWLILNPSDVSAVGWTAISSSPFSLWNFIKVFPLHLLPCRCLRGQR